MKLYEYTIYKEDGTIEEVAPRGQMTLSELQEVVGGRIELVPRHFTKGKINHRFNVFCNEEGKFNGSIQNPHFEPYHLDASETITGEPWDDYITGVVVVERPAGKPVL